MKHATSFGQPSEKKYMLNAAMHLETTTDVTSATLSSHNTKPAYTSEAKAASKTKPLDISLNLFANLLSLVSMLGTGFGHLILTQLVNIAE
jgi:hypothetical protein